jgi:hypothetical protein
MSIWIKVLGAAAVLSVTASTGFAASFNSAVEQVLLQQKEVKELDAERQGRMVACVQQTLSKIPAERQSYIASAADQSEMEDRFGEVVLADQAKFKKQITKDCGGIALEK